MFGQKPKTPHQSEATAQPKYIPIDRAQGRFVSLILDDLVGAEHPARMIWEITGRLDWSSFEKEVASFEQQSGRAAWAPRVLASVLIYGYTLGTSAGRELERLMEHEPGLRWLTGMEIINHHTLSDFRRREAEQLQGIFQQVLALLADEGLVDFGTLLQDGTKIKAQASRGSMHRRKTLEQHLEEAKSCVAALDRRGNEEEGTGNRDGGAQKNKKESAQQRGARERLARMEAALRELERREASAEPAQVEKLRVSESEPEARKMKHPDGSFHPSFNLQLVTEGRNGFITGCSVSTDLNDQHQLQPCIAKAAKLTGQAAKTVIGDGGYATRENIEALTEQNITFVAPFKEDVSRQAGALAKAGIAIEFAAGKFRSCDGGKTLTCPAGAVLVQIGTGFHHGQKVQRYQASAAVCLGCSEKPRCTPKRDARLIEKVIESEAVQQHIQRMEQEATQELYRKRAPIAEYPHLRIKSNWRLDRFRLRGLANATKEAFWMVLAFTFDRWHSLRRRNANAVPAAA